MFKPTTRTDGDAYGKEDLNEVLAKARYGGVCHSCGGGGGADQILCFSLCLLLSLTLRADLKSIPVSKAPMVPAPAAAAENRFSSSERRRATRRM
jgi:hypothetical protein